MDYFTSGNNSEEATIVSLEGRMYPVEIAYLEEPTPDYVKTAAEVAWRINLQVGPSIVCQAYKYEGCEQGGSGDILIFLTGREEIERCLEDLTELLPT